MRREDELPLLFTAVQLGASAFVVVYRLRGAARLIYSHTSLTALVDVQMNASPVQCPASVKFVAT